jgi:hypothetical protein
MWKWSTFVTGVVVTGQAHSKAGAVAAAEKAIDRALAVKKVRLVPPQRLRLMPSPCQRSIVPNTWSQSVVLTP